MKDWQKVEAVLFGTGKYLTEDEIIELSGVPKNKLKKALNELKKHYDKINSSLQIYKELDTWKLNVKEDFKDIMKNVVSDAEMPKPIMETLAVIAYKAPVLQSQVVDARGSGAYEHIGLLEKKGFIEKEKYQRTYKLRLGEKFFDYFDIEGPAQIDEVFKDAKKPEKMGDLQVYESDDNEEEFSQKIIDRMKKVETTSKDEKENEDFLDKFDEKINQAKERIDETESDMSEFKREEPEEESLNDEDSKEIFDDSSDEEEGDEKLGEDASTEDILKKVNKDIDEITGENENSEEEK